ncbi:MAG: T9SS type A sorting domain-containing protein [Bacteroidia bacterium]|nr:T9SS type A sorting domain-containing protein [Bacteroidia bacterium]
MKVIFTSFFLLGMAPTFGQTVGPAAPTITENRPPCSCYPGEYYATIQNANASDDQCVNAVLELRPDCQNDSCFYTRYFYAHGFGFSIPLNALITGITVEVERSADIPGIASDSVMRLVPMNWAVVGNNYAVPNVFGSTDSVVTYGGATDLWGYPFTVNEVNSPDFGLAYIIKNNSSALSPTICIDHIQLRVDYTLTTGECCTQYASPFGFSVAVTPDKIQVNSGSLVPGTSLKVSLMSTGGSKVWSSGWKGNGSLEIFSGGMPAGTYLVVIEGAERPYVQKIVLSR